VKNEARPGNGADRLGFGVDALGLEIFKRDEKNKGTF
jgi:hypothetical protein